MTATRLMTDTIPYARRRNTPAQLAALRRLFDITPHPSRAQRQALANEVGMEFKSVTNWFQNKRQTSKRKSSSLSENNPIPITTRSSFTRRKNPLDRSQISLDRIASLFERPSLTSSEQLHLQRAPLTPRKNTVQQRDPSSPSGIWTRMLSSPAVPPSAPDPEEVRLVALSSRAETLYSLEWACLKARQKIREDEDIDRLSASGHCQGVDEDDDATHLEPTAIVSAKCEAASVDKKNIVFCRPTMERQLEDVEAAITLLGFKTSS